MAADLRTIEEIKKDIASTQGAMRAMADLDCHGDSGDNEAKGIFLDNCARRIDELQSELRQARANRPKKR